jgi:alpha-tubulin suppressor-like RCC1 family protein
MSSSDRVHLAMVSSHPRFHEVFEDSNIDIESLFIFGDKNAIVLTKNDEVYKLETDSREFYGKSSGNKKYKLLTDLSKKDLTTFVAGDKHSYALSKNGNVYCWGQNNNGELGNGKVTDILEKFEENHFLSALNLSNSEELLRIFKENHEQARGIICFTSPDCWLVPLRRTNLRYFCICNPYNFLVSL